MSLLLYIIAISVLGLVILFGYQLHRLGSGAVAYLPNVRAHEVVAPFISFARHWYMIVLDHIHAFSYPILMLFYKGLLRLLHRLTSRIAHRFNHLADTIKGKSIVNEH